MQYPNIAELLALPEGPERTAGLAAWIQGLFSRDQVPVLVGGAVVELLTGGAYTTGDLDFVGVVSEEAASQLAEEGFERRGRHWVHSEGELFVEFPSDSLDPEEGPVALEVAGTELLVLAPEAVIVDLLAAWEHWDSTTDAVNAFLVRRATRSQIDRRRMLRLVAKRRVAEAWESLESFAERLGDAVPSAEELERWAERRDA